MSRVHKYSNPYPLRLNPETRSRLEVLSNARRIPVSSLVKMAIDLLWDQEKNKIQPEMDRLKKSVLSRIVRELIDASYH